MTEKAPHRSNITHEGSMRTQAMPRTNYSPSGYNRGDEMGSYTSHWPEMNRFQFSPKRITPSSSSQPFTLQISRTTASR